MYNIIIIIRSNNEHCVQDLHYIDDYACMLGTGCLDVQTYTHIHTWMCLPAIYTAQDHIYIQNESTYIMYHACNL